MLFFLMHIIRGFGSTKQVAFLASLGLVVEFAFALEILLSVCVALAVLHMRMDELDVGSCLSAMFALVRLD